MTAHQTARVPHPGTPAALPPGATAGEEVPGSDPGPGTSQTSLEYWRDLVLAQADTIKAHDEAIRALIRDTDTMAPYTGCPEHGAQATTLLTECQQLEDDERAADASRIVYASACNYLRFLSASAVVKITPELLSDWVAKVRTNAARRLADPDERENVEPAATDRKPFWEMPKPEGWVDPRETVEYWQRIAPRQAETIAGHAAELAEYTAKRDAEVARLSQCNLHADYIEGTVEQRNRQRVQLARTRKALAIFEKWFAELAETAEVPAGLVASAKRVGDRAHRAWNP